MQFEDLSPNLLQSFTVAKVNKENSRAINSIDYDSEGGLLLTSSDDESMHVYSCNSGKLHNTIYSKKYGCTLAKFAHRSKNVLYASTKGEDALRFMSLHDNKYIRYFKGHTAQVMSLEISPEDDSFISAANDNTVQIWDLRNPQCCGIIATEGGNPCLAFDPSAKVFALGLGNNSIRMYAMTNPGTGPFLTEEIVDDELSEPVEWTKISFSNDGRHLLISTRGNVLYILDAMKATLLHKLKGHSNPLGLPLEANFTPDGRYVTGGLPN